MESITVGFADIVRAVKKADMTGAKNFKITLFPQKREMGGCNILTISASNGTFHIDTSIKCNVEGEMEMAKVYAVSSVFASVVQTLAPVSDEENLNICIDDASITVKRGSANVPLAQVNADKVTMIEPCNSQKQENFSVIINTEEFAKAISKGGAAAEQHGDRSNSYFNDSLLMAPAKDSSMELLSVTVSGSMCSGCKCSVEIQNKDNEIFDKKLSEGKVYSLSASFVKKIADTFGGKSIWHFFENQVIISSNMDVFILPVKNFALDISGIRNLAFSIPECLFEITASKRAINSAVSVALLNPATLDAQKASVFHASSGNLMIASYDKRNTIVAETEEVNGEALFCLTVSLMKKAMESSGDDLVRICGTSGEAPVYFLDSFNKGACVVLPIRLNNERKECELVDDSQKSAEKNEQGDSAGE